MADIITTDTAIRFKGSSVAKSSLTKVNDFLGDKPGVRVYGPSVSLQIFLTDTIDGQSFGSIKDLREYVDANFFKAGGGDGQGVTWDDVQDKPLKALATPIADAEGLVPVYTQEGQLPVGTPEFPENAVPLALLDVRVPTGGTNGQVLKKNAEGDNIWAADLNTTYVPATTTVDGLMSATDKVKLNDLNPLPAGGTSSTFLSGTGVWATPTNTTYTAITAAEFNTGTASTARAVSAVSLNRDIQAKVISYLTSLDGFEEGAVLTATATGFEWVLPTP